MSIYMCACVSAGMCMLQHTGGRERTVLTSAPCSLPCLSQDLLFVGGYAHLDDLRDTRHSPASRCHLKVGALEVETYTITPDLHGF